MAGSTDNQQIIQYRYGGIQAVKVHWISPSVGKVKINGLNCLTLKSSYAIPYN